MAPATVCLFRALLRPLGVFASLRLCVEFPLHGYGCVRTLPSPVSCSPISISSDLFRLSAFGRQFQKSRMAAKKRRRHKKRPFSHTACVFCASLRQVLQLVLGFRISDFGFRISASARPVPLNPLRHQPARPAPPRISSSILPCNSNTGTGTPGTRSPRGSARSR